MANGIVTISTTHSVADVVEKLKAILHSKNVKLFAVIDHSGEAEAAGLSMPNTKLLIFGNPVAGTPVMLATPTAALDLPLKILVAEDTAGKVRIAYNSAEYLRDRHEIPADLIANLAVIAKIAEAAAA
jgi:uncharacterized protein (DUF302 family)